MIIQEKNLSINTSNGLMQTYLYQPQLEDKKYPGLILYSEIFQQTGPIKRMAMYLAGHGFLVAVPEIFHELEAPGAVLPYDKNGTERGNSHKYHKTLQSYDEDARQLVTALQGMDSCSGRIGTIGTCIGGHLAFRAAMNPQILSAACFYATDIHSSSLGRGKSDDSLQRAGEIKGELMMIWGRQDPHIPIEGRRLIYDRLAACQTNFTWHEFNAAHAFMRDEGHRYDPELAAVCYRLAVNLFKRTLT